MRKCKQKCNRTAFQSFLIKLLKTVNYSFKIEMPKKLSTKTFCLVIEQIIDEKGIVQETYDGCVWTIKEMYSKSSQMKNKRNDIRECVMVMMTNMLLFIIEQHGGYIHRVGKKKSAVHLLFTTETIEYIIFDGRKYLFEEMLSLGDEFFHTTLKHSLGSCL